MKVLMISWEFPPVMVGGLGAHVDRLVGELAAAGHEVVVVTRAPAASPGVVAKTTDEMRGKVRVVSVPLTPLAIDFTSDLMAWTLLMGTAMTQAIQHLLHGTGPCSEHGAWQPDVIHAHDWLVAVPACAIAEQYGLPLVGTFHATEAGRNSGWLSHTLNRHVHSAEWWFAHSCDYLIACSRPMVDEVSAAFGDPASGSPGLPPLRFIPNGIDTRGWTIPHRPARATTAPHLIYFGRLEWEKGVHDILSSLPLLRRRYPGIHVTIAGEGMKREWLESEQCRHRLCGPVHFAGFMKKDELRELISTADLAVLPSRYEPFGIVALEAAAAGIPVVAARAGGLADIIVDGKTGWSYSPGIIDEIVETIDAALQNPVERNRRAAANRAQLPQRFCWTHIAQQTVQVYECAVAGSTRRAQLALPRPLIPLRPLPERDWTTPVDVATTVPQP